MKIVKTMLIVSFLIGVLVIAGRPQTTPVAAQVAGQTNILLENFSNGTNPPRLNTFHFNHNFTHSTAWNLGGTTVGDPLSQSPPFALELYAGNTDRVTFNQPSFFANVTQAQVWAWGFPAGNDFPASRGRVIFEGTGDSKTFTFTGGTQWKLYRAVESDVGDNGRLLGAIIAVQLINLDPVGDGGEVLFDDLQVVSVTPPRRSNLTLTMAGPASPLTVGSIVNYSLTVTNTGPESAPNVVLEDTLPAGSSFVSSGSTTGCGHAFGRVRCNLGTLAVGATQTVMLRLAVGSDACSTFTNRATVTAQAYDNNMADNTAVHTATTPLATCADYAVTLIGNQVPVDPEEMFTYELTIRNNGPDTSGGTLDVTWPEQMFVFKVTPDSGVRCPATDPLFCIIDPLAAGEQKQIIITGFVTAEGLLDANAQVTPSLRDPQLDNNTSRYRFAVGSPYSYRLIAEAGVGELAGFTEVRSSEINNNGEVAFLAQNENDWAVFVSDGTTFNRRFELADLPPVVDPLRYGNPWCLSINDSGWVAASVETLTGSGNMVGSALYLLPPTSSPILLDEASEAVDGLSYRRYAPPAINNSGRVLAYYNANGPDGITQFMDGQQTEIYTTTKTLLSIGLNDHNDYAYKEVTGILFPSYQLLLRRQGSSAPINILQNNAVNPQTGKVMSLNEWGQLPYSQRFWDASTNTAYGAFYTGGSQPVFQTQVLSTDLFANYGEASINDYGRWVVEGARWGSEQDQHGLFVGPHYLAHRVVRETANAEAAPGTPMFGSWIDIFFMMCKPPINDAGQIAFAARLADGRYVVVVAEPTQDNDGDGVLDYDELGAANFGDGNGDGVPDSVQPHVAAVPSLVDPFTTIAFTTNPNYTLTNVQAIPNPSPGNAPSDTFSLGFFSLQITDVPVGGAADVAVTLPWIAVRRWWKYGRTPDNLTPHWYDFTFDGTTGAEINGNVVTLHFVDGQRGDEDLTANGVIVDPGGPSEFPFATYLPSVQR